MQIPARATGPTLRAWAPVVGWMIVIFFFSSQPDPDPAPVGSYHLGLPKVAHFIEYVVLALLVVRGLWYARFRVPWWWAFVFVVGYAIADEIHQSFVPGRRPAAEDVGIDAAGSLAGLYLWWRLSASDSFGEAEGQPPPLEAATVTRRRVVVLGRTTLAVECLQIVRDAGDDVVLVLADPGDDGVDGWQRSLRGEAERLGIPTLAERSVNDPQVIETVRSARPEILLSFQAGWLLKAPLIATPTIAALNLHFGPLPRYRGVAPIAWAIINGEQATGVTLHHIDAGIDSGPIIASAEVPIDVSDTGRTLYDKCSASAIRLFREQWPTLRETVPQGTPQNADAALYYNRWAMDFSNRRIRWEADCEALANWIRAFIFPPFQYPQVALPDGRTLDIAAITWNRGPHRGRPGEVLAVHADGVVVAAAGGLLLIRELSEEGRILSAADLDDAGLVPGIRLN